MVSVCSSWIPSFEAKQSNKQINKQANKQTNKQINKQTNERQKTNKQTKNYKLIYREESQKSWARYL